MALLDEWRKKAYDTQNYSKDSLKRMWDDYFKEEKRVYAELLENPDEEVKGTVKELAEKYNLTVMYMTAFLDGIQESLKAPNPIETMEEDTEVSLAFDKEMLFKNMVDARADWLYKLPQWNAIFDADRQASLIREAREMGTVKKPKKIYPNDPCPCGSGKKYKKCCGKAI
ncbi:MAG: hypothetical protein BWY61_00811 [Firmicutes bacterium ADurb.Bin354]|nr:MAG: hypothetical protein BWY61_00811 [Firmicutes bacterium ADurb.Bin354]